MFSSLSLVSLESKVFSLFFCFFYFEVIFFKCLYITLVFISFLFHLLVFAVLLWLWFFIFWSISIFSCFSLSSLIFSCFSVIFCWLLMNYSAFPLFPFCFCSVVSASSIFSFFSCPLVFLPCITLLLCFVPHLFSSLSYITSSTVNFFCFFPLRSVAACISFCWSPCAMVPSFRLFFTILSSMILSCFVFAISTLV